MKQRKKALYSAIIVTISMIFNICSPVFSKEIKAYTIEEKVENKSLEKNKVYYGFKLIEKKSIKDNNSNAMTFYHEKSGAKLFFMENKDPNKYFSISFRTPAFNDKGTAHVLEHSVLVGGSKKYPVKQLLKEVLESSISKDLNGLTTPDTTIYPFSSTNEKEFKNIMDIYMDMVFNPSFYNDSKIFKEEGWYYNIDKNGKNLKYNGVVYNEMKGAMSSPSDLLYHSICKSLYPDTIYAHISGGDPNKITDLTFDELKNFHKKYYHPSNSYIFLYGNITILERLKFLDEGYLNKYKSTKIDSEIKAQTPFCNTQYKTFVYPVSKEERDKNRTFLTYNFAINDKKGDTDTALHMLNHMLLNNPNSPLLRNLRRYGFNNVTGGYVNQQKQPFFTIIAANTEVNRQKEFENIINNTLKQICNNGFDKKLIKTTLNYLDINSRWDSSYNKNSGMIYNELVLNKWIYNENPMNIFTSKKDHEKIINSIKNSYFEDIIYKYFLNNKHNSIMILKPEKGLLEKNKEKEEEKLNKFKNSLSKDELDKLIRDTKELKTWFNTPTKEENLNKIPRLKLKDVNPKIELMPLNRKKQENVDILFHPWNTNETTFLNLYFDTNILKEEQVSYMSLLSTILGNVSTKNYKIGELYNKEMTYTTGVKYGISTYSSIKDREKIKPQFYISSLCRSENIDETLKIINEEIFNSKYKNKEFLRLIIKSIRSSLEEYSYNSAHILALNKNFSNFSKEQKYKNYLNGISYIEFIKDLDNNFDKKYEEIVYNLEDVNNKIFNKNNLTISITTDNNGYKKFKKPFKKFVTKLDNKDTKKKNIEFKTQYKQEAFTKNIDVLYNVQGFNFKNYNEKYNGNMLVLKNIIDLDYLWPRIRVKGGAYGINLLLSPKGDIGIVSYRDPNLIETLEAYKGIPKYLANLNLSKRELESYKISALAPYCHTKNVEEKVLQADSMYFSDRKREDLEKELREIKSTTLKDLKKYEELFKKGLKENNITVIGNKIKIQKSKNIFNKVEGI